jgi:hypothetical protein
MAEVKLIYVNSDSDYTEVSPLVDTTTFGGLTISDGTGTLVIDPNAGPGGTTPEIDMGGGEITDLALPDGTDLTAAATVGYVINSLDGLDVKLSVRAASLANITLTAGSSPDAVDGINVKSVGVRILVKNQILTEDNGIYEVSAAPVGSNNNTWIRATDADTIAKLNANAFTFVEEGTQEDTGWVVTTEPATLGTDPIVWTQFSKKGVLTASFGIEIVTNDIRLDLLGGSGGTGGLSITGNEVGINFSVSPFNQANRPIAADKLASTSSGEGASIIGIQDAGTYYTSTDVEGALQEIGADLVALAPTAFSMTSGGSGVTKGDLLYMSGNNTVDPMPINALHRPIGVATATVGASTLVGVIDHGLLTGIGAGAFGSQNFWNGSVWTTTAPSAAGTYVWKVGVTANGSGDAVVFPSFVKKNS